MSTPGVEKENTVVEFHQDKISQMFNQKRVFDKVYIGRLFQESLG